MDTFPSGFRALVIGSTGSIGSAFVQALADNPRCGHVQGLHRHSEPVINFDDESSIAAAAAALGSQTKFHLIINAAGLLHANNFMPEKKLADLNYAQLMDTFRVNTFGPALVLRHFTPLLHQDRSVMAVISAKVGSIEDNRLGGWYSYRASKAALNMLLKTAAIEVKRHKPQSVLVSLHPGTVSSNLSGPFRGAEIGRPAADAAADMLRIINNLTIESTGQFYAWSGEKLPW